MEVRTSATDCLDNNCVTVLGNPDAAQTLIFAHGFGSDQTAWQSITPAFEDRYRIVLFDHAWHGGSERTAFAPHRYLNLHAYAQDLLGICQSLDLSNAVAIGHSVGAMIALLASIERPVHFSSLVMIGASARYLDAPDYTGGFNSDDLASVYREIMANYTRWVDQFAPLMIGEDQPPHFTRKFAASLKAIPKEHALTVACAIFQSDHRADLAHVSLPTLLLQTREDPAVPMSAASYLHDHIAGSVLRVIDTCGHLPHVTAPLQIVQAIDDFLSA